MMCCLDKWCPRYSEAPLRSQPKITQFVILSIPPHCHPEPAAKDLCPAQPRASTRDDSRLSPQIVIRHPSFILYSTDPVRRKQKRKIPSHSTTMSEIRGWEEGMGRGEGEDVVPCRNKFSGKRLPTPYLDSAQIALCEEPLHALFMEVGISLDWKRTIPSARFF